MSCPVYTPNLLVRSCLALLLSAALLVSASNARADVLLHAFNWHYNAVEAAAADIAAAGYRGVLVAPPVRSEGNEWWARYQPQDLRLIDHPLGDTLDFVAMSQALQSHGVRVYADIILNHMANEAWRRPDLNYPGQRLLDIYAADPQRHADLRLFGNLQFNFLSLSDFGPSTCINDYSNVWQVQTWRLCGAPPDVGLPDLLANSWVISQQQQYLLALKALGVEGFRLDAVKHMPNSHINAVLTPAIRTGMHVFGEIITSGGVGDSSYEGFLAPYLAQTDHGAYDFPLFESMRSAFGFGGSMSELVDPGAYGQALPGARAITFAVTHDIPNNAGFRYLIMDPVDETLAYAYLLGRDGGVPLLYSDNNESGDQRWVDAWQRPDLIAMISFHNQVQGQDMQVLAHGGCALLFRRGSQGIVGINKCGHSVTLPVNMNNSVLWWYRNYRDVLDPSQVLYINTGNYNITLPGRTARMWLRE